MPRYRMTGARRRPCLITAKRVVSFTRFEVSLRTGGVMKTKVSLLLFVVLVVSSADAQRRSRKGTQSGAGGEFAQQAKRYWDSVTAKCGQSVYILDVYGAGGWYEMRGVTIANDLER